MFICVILQAFRMPCLCSGSSRASNAVALDPRGAPTQTLLAAALVYLLRKQFLYLSLKLSKLYFLYLHHLLAPNSYSASVLLVVQVSGFPHP